MPLPTRSLLAPLGQFPRHRQLSTVARGVEPALGLYLHIPFCERKCPYCDFNTYAGLQEHFDAMVAALCAEMASWSDALAGRALTSIFVGGGTPTVLSAALLTQLFDTLFTSFTLTPDCEITCEANPGTVDRPKFQHLRSLGVNRLSLGVQSFQPQELAFLGRIHGVDDVTRAVEAAREAGFDNINLDFMFGLPGQELAAWDATLTRALDLATEHLSLYSLIVEPNTPLHHWVDSGRVAAPDEDAAADLYEHAMNRLAAAGYVHYEVSNWAKAAPVARLDFPEAEQDVDSEALSPYVCRHNLLYWRNQEYVGIGPGAHSHVRLAPEDAAPGTQKPPPVSRRWSNRKPAPGYIRRMQTGQPVVDFTEELSAAVAMGETMMMGLRLVHEGVAFARFRAQHDCELSDVFAPQQDRLARAELIHVTPKRMRVTSRGLLLANQVAASFLADRARDAGRDVFSTSTISINGS